MDSRSIVASPRRSEGSGQGPVAEPQPTVPEVGLSAVHRLFGVGLALQALSLRQEDRYVSDHLDRCVRELDLAIADVRALVFEVEPRP